MPGLLDIAISSQTVTVNEVAVPVYGVSARGIAYLFERFPELRMLLTGKAPDLSPDAIVKLVPDGIAAIIAAGCGSPGDPAAEKVADGLSAHHQVAFLEKIVKLTMPEGAGPFVEMLARVAGGLGVESMNIPVGKSLSPSSR